MSKLLKVVKDLVKAAGRGTEFNNAPHFHMRLE
jgi:hypothetical protein